jgi:hypothetical protein
MKQLEWQPDLGSPIAGALMLEVAEGHTIRRTHAREEGWLFECTCSWGAVHHTDKPAEKHAKQVTPPPPDPKRPTIFEILRLRGKK